MKLKLFTATALGCQDEWPAIKGLDFYGPPEQIKVLWYPFQEWARKVHFWAPNRREAAKQAERGGLRIRDLNDGRNTLKPAQCILREFAPSI